MKVLCCLALLLGAASALHESIILPEGISEKAFVNLGGRDYYFETSNPSKWTQARNFCRTLGMFLLSIETVEENNLIKDHIYNVAGYLHFWTGGNDFGRVRGDYVWDATGSKIIYTDWHTSEPSFGDGEYFIEIQPYDGQLQWNDATDDNRNNCFTICEQA